MATMPAGGPRGPRRRAPHLVLVQGGANPRPGTPADQEAARSDLDQPPPPVRREPSPAPPPIRLTRRGRIVLVLATAALTLPALWLTADRGARAGAPQPPAASLQTVVVGSQDTLWAIAAEHSPHTDPRITVHRIIQLNGLDNAIVHPGQRLRLPPR